MKYFTQNLPPSQPIVVKDYSLEADMYFGWQPKIQFQGPVPMTFDNNFVDIIISHLNSPLLNKTPYKLIYLGFRPANSLKLHSAYCDNAKEDSYYFKFNSLFGNARMNGFFHSLESKNKNKYILPFLGMNPQLQNVSPQQQNMNPQPQNVNVLKGNSPRNSSYNISNIVQSSQNQKSNFNSQINKLKLENSDINGTFGLTQSSIVTKSNTPQHNTQYSSNVKNEFNQEVEDFDNSYSQPLTFDSYFESGNLDCAVQVGQNEYDLFMRVDSNTKGHLQWYYFKVSGAKSLQRVKFNICNFSKNKSLYMRGMKPYIYSQKDNQFFKNDWSQQGEKITYLMREFRYPFLKEYIEDQRPKTYYQLSFEYVFKYEDDVVSFAYCPPYTFSYLTTFLKEISMNHKLQDKNFLKEEKLSSSMSGLDVPLLTITDFNSPNDEIEKRKVVLISARIHPGESNGSYMMHGFLKYIMTEEAEELRKKCIFKVVPMLNPDGVVLGNYRTGIAGRDLNRVFSNPDKMLYPTVIGLKELISQTKKQYGANLIMFLDLHGHSVKKNVFTYGPDYPIFDLNYYKCRLFSKILAKQTDMFRYFSCIFRISQMKKNTARGVFFNNYDIANCFTIEASNGSYYIGNSTTIDFQINNWIEMGAQIAKGINEYIQTTLDYEQAQQLKMAQRKIEKDMKFQDEQQLQYSTQATTTGSRSDTSGFITQRTLNYRAVAALDENSPTNISKTKQEKPSQKYQSDSENDNQLNYLSKTNANAKVDKKKKIANSKNRMNFKIQKINSKSSSYNKQFLLEESPFSKYFSRQIEADEKNQKNDAESDGFSEGGSDSESEGEDYDKAFLKNFQIIVQRDFQLFDSFFRNLENFDVKTEQTANKKNQAEVIKGKEEYLNDKISAQLTSKKYDFQNQFNKINSDGRQSFNQNSATTTPTHLKPPVIRPKTNDKVYKIEYQLGAANSSRNSPQKQALGINQMGWDIFKDRNPQQKKRQSRSQLKDNSNLLSTQMNFQSWSDQKAAAANKLNLDKYDDLYNQEFSQIEQAFGINQSNSRASRNNSATPFKDDNLNIINLLHRVHHTPLVQTTNNQSLIKIINKIKEGGDRQRAIEDLDEISGKRVLVLTNNNMYPNINNSNNMYGNNINLVTNNNIGRSNPLVGNRIILENTSLNSKNKVGSTQQQQSKGPSSVHLKNILNSSLFNNLSQMKEKSNNLSIIPPIGQYSSNGNNGQVNSSQTSPKRQITQSYQQFLQMQQMKNEEYSISRQAIQNSYQDPYYVSSTGFGNIKEINKDDQPIHFVIGPNRNYRETSLQTSSNNPIHHGSSNSNSNNNSNTNNNNNNSNKQMLSTFNNKFHSTNTTPISSLSPIKNSSNHSNQGNQNFSRRTSQQPHFPQNLNNNTMIYNPNATTSYANISPRESSSKKMNCPSAFYKMKKHFTSKKKPEDSQKSYSGYNPNINNNQLQQHQQQLL